jgi:ribose transport system substrate-binding protein
MTSTHSVDGIGRRQFLWGAGGALGLAALGIGLGACGSSGSTSKQIGFAFSDTRVDVFKPLIAGARAEGKIRGYTVEVSSPQNSAETQVSDINTWIGQGIAAIVILPLDANAIAGVTAHANSKNIPVVGYSDQIPGEKGYDIFDHAQGAALLGHYAVGWINQNLGGKANIGLLALDSVEVGRIRIDGALRVIQQAVPDAKVVSRQQAADAATGLTTLKSMLQAHPDIDVILCVNDDVVNGANQALLQSGKNPNKVFLAGFDGDRQAMQLVLDGGFVKADAALPLKQIGEAVVWVPANIIEKKTPVSYTAQYALVTPQSRAVGQRLIADFGS